MHWFEGLFSRISEVMHGPRLVVSAGLSVSGLQHVGRLRGEIVIPNTVANRFRGAGTRVTQYLVLYTQDSWKGKDAQLGAFKGDEGRQYAGRRLLDVPDPHGCHRNWTAHYWRDFGDHLDSFANDVMVVTTSDLYERDELRKIVFDVVERKDEVREIVNRYRGTKKMEPGWIPFEPYCTRCRTVGKAKALELDDAVSYSCQCGHEGASPLPLGKLNWRLEWPALWKLLKVDVEPFGKDHATPGGSRDSCVEIARKILGIEPPFGIPYEWVGLSRDGKDLGDMSSSSFLGFSPREWVEVAEPDVLRYIYLRNDHMKRIVLDLGKLDSYHDAFDNAENAFSKKARDEDAELEAHSWHLATRGARAPMFTIPFSHAALLSQILPSDGGLDWALARLRDTGIVKGELSPEERERIGTRLGRARLWVERHSPQNRVEISERIGAEAKAMLNPEDREALRMLADSVSGIEWTEEALKEAMVALTKGGKLPVDTKRFFAALYIAFLGRERGPRAAPFLSVLDRKMVIERLREAAE